jgi:hypothetical protein
MVMSGGKNLLNFQLTFLKQVGTIRLFMQPITCHFFRTNFLVNVLTGLAEAFVRPIMLKAINYQFAVAVIVEMAEPVSLKNQLFRLQTVSHHHQIAY